MAYNELIERDKKLSAACHKVKYYCKNCGHSVIIINKVKKNLCDWCGHYVFKNDRDEFEYRLKEKLNKLRSI